MVHVENMAVVLLATALAKKSYEPLQYAHVQGYQITLNPLGVSRIVVQEECPETGTQSIPIEQNPC